MPREDSLRACTLNKPVPSAGRRVISSCGLGGMQTADRRLQSVAKDLGIGHIPWVANFCTSWETLCFWRRMSCRYRRCHSYRALLRLLLYLISKDRIIWLTYPCVHRKAKYTKNEPLAAFVHTHVLFRCIYSNNWYFPDLIFKSNPLKSECDLNNI